MRQARTLLLNKNYVPIKIGSAYSAIGKLFCEKVEAVHINNDGSYEIFNLAGWLNKSKTLVDCDYSLLNTVSGVFAIPKIVVCVEYDKVPKISLRLTRQVIYARDSHMCYICGEQFSKTQLNLDHIVPVSKGGRDSWENLITCCKKCNTSKGDKLLEDLKIKPKFLPYKPNMSNIARLKLNGKLDYKEWSLFGI